MGGDLGQRLEHAGSHGRSVQACAHAYDDYTFGFRQHVGGISQFGRRMSAGSKLIRPRSRLVSDSGCSIISLSIKCL